MLIIAGRRIYTESQSLISGYAFIAAGFGLLILGGYLGYLAHDNLIACIIGGALIFAIPAALLAVCGWAFIETDSTSE